MAKVSTALVLPPEMGLTVEELVEVLHADSMLAGRVANLVRSRVAGSSGTFAAVVKRPGVGVKGPKPTKAQTKPVETAGGARKTPKVAPAGAADTPKREPRWRRLTSSQATRLGDQAEDVERQLKTMPKVRALRFVSEMLARAKYGKDFREWGQRGPTSTPATRQRKPRTHGGVPIPRLFSKESLDSLTPQQRQALFNRVESNLAKKPNENLRRVLQGAKARYQTQVSQVLTKDLRKQVGLRAQLGLLHQVPILEKKSQGQLKREKKALSRRA